VSQALVLAGWLVALVGVGAAFAARYRTASLGEAVARACHELRGPLAAARLGLEPPVCGGQLADARLRAIELELGRATLALEDLSEACDAAATRRRVVEVIRGEAVDVAQLLVDLVQAWEGPARARGVEIALAGSGSTPVVHGDRLRLAQAVGNLIANAVEHGGGVVAVSWHAAPATVRIEVADRGDGLPAPVAELARRRPLRWPLPRRGGPAQARQRAGSRRGHGLAIATAIAARHGGRLAAAPSDQGAKLVLELPLATGPVPAAHPRPAG
jgi:signal transduction histidine kinase